MMKPTLKTLLKFKAASTAYPTSEPINAVLKTKLSSAIFLNSLCGIRLKKLLPASSVKGKVIILYSGNSYIALRNFSAVILAIFLNLYTRLTMFLFLFQTLPYTVSASMANALSIP